MKKIPYEELIELLGDAHDITVMNVACTTGSFYLSPGDPERFLEITADDGDGRTFEWCFDMANNMEVTADGDTVTLIASADEFNEQGPIEVQLMTPMRFDTIRVVTCVYCGMAYTNLNAMHQDKLLTDHIKVCEKHPMRQVEAGYADLSARLSRILAVAEDMRDHPDGFTLRTILKNLTRGFDAQGKPIPKA